ncbi:sensor histidine kinase [Kineococcus gypseus]|uniref:sensor histidine kinase n=1 Tax=Kineococcus gypseus TaxID=1637102 RepID=UPI003D7CBC4B
MVVAQALALVRRRAHPRAVLALVAAGVPVAALAGLGELVGTTTLAVLVAACSATLAGTPAGTLRRALPVLGAAAVLVGAGTLLAQPAEGAPLLVRLGAPLAQALVVVALPASAGVVVGSRREAARARARQVEALAREHDARVEAAVARERAAMARELHDIAAHHLSGIAVMTGAIGRQIDVDPAAAKAAVQRVRTETSAMLDQLRALVRLLRDAPEDTARPVEALAAVPALVERARAAGVDASLTLLGDPAGRWGAIGPLAQLAAFRMVQECLANVVRHAPGARCEVVLDARDPAVLRVGVVNGPAPVPPPASAAPPGPGRDQRPGGGLGLVGMRERAELTGARLSAGPEPGGGWRVALDVPTHRGAGQPREAARAQGAVR